MKSTVSMTKSHFWTENIFWNLQNRHFLPFRFYVKLTFTILDFHKCHLNSFWDLNFNFGQFQPYKKCPNLPNLNFRAFKIDKKIVVATLSFFREINFSHLSLKNCQVLTILRLFSTLILKNLKCKKIHQFINIKIQSL